MLYGEIAYVPLDLWVTKSGYNMGPRTVWIASGLLLLIVLFIWKGYKGLFITTFNEEFAKALGIGVAFWHYALMGAVSLTTVVSFESVGAILVVALLIVPPATAYLITTNLKKMLVLASIFGILSAFGGYYLAAAINGSIAGAMATVAGILFAPDSGENTRQKIKDTAGDLADDVKDRYEQEIEGLKDKVAELTAKAAETGEKLSNK